MPRRRLTQHGMDVVFKLEAQQLGSALSRRFGINFPRVVRHFPTDLPVADVHLEQLDAVFELADGSLLHLEFQTEHRRETLARFLITTPICTNGTGARFTRSCFMALACRPSRHVLRAARYTIG